MRWRSRVRLPAPQPERSSVEATSEEVPCDCNTNNMFNGPSFHVLGVGPKTPKRFQTLSKSTSGFDPQSQLFSPVLPRDDWDARPWPLRPHDETAPPGAAEQPTLGGAQEKQLLHRFSKSRNRVVHGVFHESLGVTWCFPLVSCCFMVFLCDSP